MDIRARKKLRLRNFGILEKWNNEVYKKDSKPNNPAFHYSIVPGFI
jgi:hypothetical protein